MVFHSPLPDVTIPEVALTPFVLQRASALGDRPALIDGPSGRTITYRQLQQGIHAIAAGLAKRGFGKGDVFAIYSPNLPEYAVAFHAVSLAGGTTTTVNPLYTVDELVRQLKDSGASYLLTIPQFMDKARQAAQESGITRLFVFGEAEGAEPFASLMQPGPPPAVSIDPRNDVVVLPYSSGTTGLPKGVMLTHFNLVANVLQSHAVWTGDQAETVVAVLPFYHSYGLTVLMNLSLYVGHTVITLPRFDLEQFLDMHQRYGVTFDYLVPPIVLALAKHPVVDRYDLSKLQRIISGAAPLDASLEKACSDRLGCVVTQGYGLTETSPVVSANNPYEPRSIRPGSAGRLIPNSEARVVDPVDGRELGRTEQGEVWYRGPQIMKGYLNNPQATAHTIDAEGWLHSGDIGFIDEDEHLYIVDRLKELIKYKGMQVAPAELEGILVSHPAIADAAVIPVPDAEAGEIPKAFVVLKGQVTPDELMAWVAERVAPHKKIRRVEVVDQIPKATSGKILRRVLVERERAKLPA
ncbi:MAG: 4-coumarate--CoA ligase family protein [Chloroflexi bacterium]|nr:MAG: 4-coumarate--CoA ligase family protein [Chloroflexota bacterium]